MIDLAAVLDSEALECALESARRLSLTTDTQLLRRLAIVGGKGRPGVAELNTILGAVRG